MRLNVHLNEIVLLQNNFEYIQEAATLYDNDAYILQLNNIDVESGRLKKSNRMVLESIYQRLEEEE